MPRGVVEFVGAVVLHLLHVAVETRLNLGSSVLERHFDAVVVVVVGGAQDEAVCLQTPEARREVVDGGGAGVSEVHPHLVVPVERGHLSHCGGVECR